MSGAETGVTHPDASAPNDDADEFNRFDPSDWAWEFLRRNRDYKRAWRSSAPRRLPLAKLADGTLLLRLRRRFPRAEQWGLYAFVDPARRARDIPVFWLPGVQRRTVRARCDMAISSKNANRLTLAAFRAARTTVIGVEGIPLVTMKGNSVSVGLIARGWHVLTRPAAVTFELDAFHDLGVQTDCIKHLHRFAEANDSGQIGRSPWGGDERLRHALIALDGSLSGKSYREIAILIFGKQRVADDWNGASRFMKDRVRRLVAKGHELMDGGYRELLR